FEPRRGIKGLRLDAEYYKIEQFGAISTLSAQQIVTNEDLYPGRVVRDAGGKITLVDTSSLNLYKVTAEGWDFSADYSGKTSVGTWSLHAVESVIRHLRSQYS